MKIRNVCMSLLAVALIWSCGKDEDPAPPKNSAPVIAAKTFTVPENIAPGTAIGTVTATDADKDALTFSISANDSDLFAITKAGVLSLASGKTLSFATKAQHVITVAVSDGEASASAKVTINVTKVDPENLSPTIEPQGFEVVESIDDAAEIGVVNATDPEGAELAFTIVANDNDLFEISAKGALTLAAGKQLDFGTAQEHTITVGVTDGNTAATADITITVTQDPLPIGDPQNFEADENIADTEVIGTVEAEDPDGQPITFSIKTNDNDLFEITESGELSLAAGMALDFETKDQHDIVVSVSDGYNSIDINVSIMVLDDGVLADDPTSFVTTWKTLMAGEAITIGTDANFNYDYTIDWGDGTIEQLIDQNPSHIYESSGNHTVAIKGVFPAIQMSNQFNPTNLKLMSIEQWGEIGWESMESAFSGCENMVYNATDVPNLSNVTSTENMFSTCVLFTGDLNNWNVGNVTNMLGMFSYSGFNGNVSNWDVSNATDMTLMFSGATAFNQDVSNWEVNNVTNMFKMFNGAVAFNQDISKWVVNKVTSMSGMFEGAISFNQDISGWTPISLTASWNMFKDATAFNQDLSGWGMSNVASMGSMFEGATAFNQSLASWDIGNVTNMSNMLNNSGLSVDNYSATLLGWSAQNVQLGVSLGAQGLQFCNTTEVVTARSILMFDKGWTFTGDTNVPCN